MKYIVSTHARIIDFNQFLSYLNTVKDVLPKSVYSFAADPKHHDLHSPQSLHDSWLENVTISHDWKVKVTNMELCFLGPFHDRKLILRYNNVASYNIPLYTKNLNRLTNFPFTDVFAHEFVIVEAGFVEHEILFDDGSSMNIIFKDFSFTEQVIGVAPE